MKRFLNDFEFSDVWLKIPKFALSEIKIIKQTAIGIFEMCFIVGEFIQEPYHTFVIFVVKNSGTNTFWVNKWHCNSLTFYKVFDYIRFVECLRCDFYR